MTDNGPVRIRRRGPRALLRIKNKEERRFHEIFQRRVDTSISSWKRLPSTNFVNLAPTMSSIIASEAVPDRATVKSHSTKLQLRLVLMMGQCVKFQRLVGYIGERLPFCHARLDHSTQEALMNAVHDGWKLMQAHLTTVRATCFLAELLVHIGRNGKRRLRH
jgi:hypothetical protein